MPERLPARVLSFGRTLRNVQRLVRAELRGSASAPLSDRLWAYRRGFTTDSFVRYGLTSENAHEYVSDVDRYIRTPKINGPYAEALNNKIVLSRIVVSHGVRAPEYYAIIEDGVFRPMGTALELRSVDDVLDACAAGSEFVVKPWSGGSGVRVLSLTNEDGTVALNHTVEDPREVRATLTSVHDGVISEFIRQHPYADRVFAHSTNSIRILTMCDPDTGEPFIPFAGHRFGRPCTAPTDNISRGGIPALVDVDRGVLVKGYPHGDMGAGGWLERHPDTGAQLAGLELPNWDRVVSGLLDLCREIAYIPYVGWDVVITEDGFAIIEGNNYPDLGHQAFYPLLIDPRVRRFYEHHGVVRPLATRGGHRTSAPSGKDEPSTPGSARNPSDPEEADRSAAPRRT